MGVAWQPSFGVTGLPVASHVDAEAGFLGAANQPVAQGNQPHILRIHQIQLDAWKKADFIDKKQMKLESGGEILIDASISDDGALSQVFSLRKG